MSHDLTLVARKTSLTIHSMKKQNLLRTDRTRLFMDSAQFNQHFTACQISKQKCMLRVRKNQKLFHTTARFKTEKSVLAPVFNQCFCNDCLNATQIHFNLTQYEAHELRE